MLGKRIVYFSLLGCLFAAVLVAALSQRDVVADSGPLNIPEIVDPQYPLEADKPNIILILTDDQRWDTLQYMSTVQNELIANGVEFTNAFASNPQCCPSRASILTGLYAHNHGVLANQGPNGGLGAFNEMRTLPRALRSLAGYETALFGKYMNGYETRGEYVPVGWDRWFGLSGSFDVENKKYYNYWVIDDGTGVQYFDAPEDYSTDVVSDKVVEYINQPRTKPFFLYYPVYAPHFPFIPADRHIGSYDGIEPWRPLNFNEPDISDKPSWFNDVPPLDVAYIDNLRQGQIEALQAVDESVADILAALEANNLDENTLIIFMSDHGYLWGEHRGEGKNCAYEECIRIPMVIWYPSKVAPGTIDELVMNVDVGVTIGRIAGLDLGSLDVDGASLLPLLYDPMVDWRDEILLEHWQQPILLNPHPDAEIENLGEIIPTYGGLRTADYKFVEYETGELELYDLAIDPYELNNVAYSPVYSSIVDTLSVRLHELWPGPGIP